MGALNGQEDNLVKDLERTTLSLEKLGERYGVSRQAIHDFCKRQGIRRKPKGHQIVECRLCQRLIQMSKKPRSEFISIPTIAKETRALRAECLSHLQTLKDEGLVDEKFGRLRSKKVEKAYAIYFTERLSIRAMGRKVGLNNFPSVIKKHRESGWNVPPPLYLYGGWGRSQDCGTNFLQHQVRREVK